MKQSELDEWVKLLHYKPTWRMTAILDDLENSITIRMYMHVIPSNKNAGTKVEKVLGRYEFVKAPDLQSPWSEYRLDTIQVPPKEVMTTEVMELLNWKTFYIQSYWENPIDSFEIFKKYVKKMIIETEMHEVDEFWSVNGIKEDDPHKESR